MSEGKWLVRAGRAKLKILTPQDRQTDRQADSSSTIKLYFPENFRDLFPESFPDFPDKFEYKPSALFYRPFV